MKTSPSSASSSSALEHKLQSIIQNNQQQYCWDYAILWKPITTADHCRRFLGHKVAASEPETGGVSVARELSTEDGDVLRKAFRSGAAVWWSSERGKEAKSHGIRTLVCVPTACGVIELGSPDVIREDPKFVEEVKSAFELLLFSLISTVEEKIVEIDPAVMEKERWKKRARDQEEAEFSSLRSLLPSVSKPDEAAVLSDTVSYINELQMKIEELESQISRDPTIPNSEEEVTSGEKRRLVEVEVEVKMMGVDRTVIRVRTKNMSYAVARLMEALRDLGLKVHHATMFNFNDLTLQNVVVEVPPELEPIEQDIQASLLKVLDHNYSH